MDIRNGLISTYNGISASLGTSNAFDIYKSTTGYVKIFNNGRAWFGSGTPVDGGFQMDINGTARVSGNMAIGTTLSSWGAGTFALEVGQGTSLWNPGGQGFSLLLTNTYNDGTNYRYKGSTIASRYQQDNIGHSWFTAPAGTAGNVISFTQRMTLTAAGRLLLGTTSEGTFILDVNGSTRFSGYVAIGSGPNGNGDLQIGKALSIGYVTATGLQGSLILGGTGTTLNSNSLTISTGGYANSLGNACVSRYILAAAPSSVGANSVTNLLVLDGETLKLNDGTSSGINSFYNAGIITVDLTVLEASTTGNSNMYAGKFVFRFKRYLINGVGTFTDISAVTNLYNSADATLVGTTLQAVANGNNALDIRVTLPSTANTASYRMGANVTITKVNNN